METIAVTGGKGGTGKSTFAILLAFRKLNEGKKVLLVDCDVECPNDYLLLGIDKLKKPIKKTSVFYPEIVAEKCLKCGLCVEKCKSNAMFQIPRQVPTIKYDLCSSCGVCWNVCPNNAIKKKKSVNGEIFISKIDKDFDLVTGRSIPGVRETSPVVRQTRKYMEKIKKDYDTVIIDTAAGTHCSVISALEKVDRAFAVTEPTPLGAHDLALILGVLKVLKVPSKVVVNQYDVGDEKLIEDLVEEKKIAAKIPYSKNLARIYSDGKLNHNHNLVSLIEFVNEDD